MPNTFSRVLFVFVLALTMPVAAGAQPADGPRRQATRPAGRAAFDGRGRSCGDDSSGAHASGDPSATAGPVTPPGSRRGRRSGGPRARQAVASYAATARAGAEDQPAQAGSLRSRRFAHLRGDGHQGSGAGRSKIKIVHKNEIGGTFQLVKLVPPGQQPGLQQVDDSGELGDLEDQRLRVVIAPGDHTVSVEIEYRDYGHGIFSYLQGRFASTPATRSHCGRQGVVIQDRLPSRGPADGDRGRRRFASPSRSGISPRRGTVMFARGPRGATLLAVLGRRPRRGVRGAAQHQTASNDVATC